ncbi:hypothetical protein Q0M94_16305 [Deinococcus radiomollis]|uniref:hypothetical protein n=1 Tax=Deinococcus radiomollis TaxID=468916 RepID=UPI003892074D
MTEAAFLVIGYAIIAGEKKSEYMHSSVADPVFSPSKCVCTFHPSNESLTWIDSDQTYLKSLVLSEVDLIEYRLEVDKLFDSGIWGFDALFTDLLAAQAFKNRWFLGISSVRLFEMSIPEDLR